MFNLRNSKQFYSGSWEWAEVSFRGIKYRFRIQRDDLIDPIVTGNKLRKLWGYDQKRGLIRHNGILTVGGAYSNHLVAVAAFYSDPRRRVVGIVRGEPNSDSKHLQMCRDYGMELHFISRADYKVKYKYIYENFVTEEFYPMVIPEGGRGAFGMLGFDYAVAGWGDFVPETVVHASATGTTAAGLFKYVRERGLKDTRIEAIAVLKNDLEQKRNIQKIMRGDDPYDPKGNMYWEQENLEKERLEREKYGDEFYEQRIKWDEEYDSKFFADRYNIEINTHYIFGGYAKSTPELRDFVASAKAETGIHFDSIYTGKALYAMLEGFESGRLNPDTTLFYHTGGIG
jgi:1-aminocyclopropane-1-carboxylate deaminase